MYSMRADRSWQLSTALQTLLCCQPSRLVQETDGCRCHTFNYANVRMLLHFGICHWRPCIVIWCAQLTTIHGVWHHSKMCCVDGLNRDSGVAACNSSGTFVNWHKIPNVKLSLPLKCTYSLECGLKIWSMRVSVEHCRFSYSFHVSLQIGCRGCISPCRMPFRWESRLHSSWCQFCCTLINSRTMVVNSTTSTTFGSLVMR